MSTPVKSEVKELAQEQALYPQEQLAKVKEDDASLLLGIPNEISMQETRLLLTPASVSVLAANGHRISDRNRGRYVFQVYRQRIQRSRERRLSTPPEKPTKPILCSR